MPGRNNAKYARPDASNSTEIPVWVPASGKLASQFGPVAQILGLVAGLPPPAQLETGHARALHLFDPQFKSSEG